ncbi:myosin heavy chain, clone 203-like protein [Gossypium australe]|uniref:Myosin heavy chain, clone 203-like protein n=1 Tax=Gossypium australe TaxID=47621 RepID=A0A5B6X0Q2_9ROSI|nr:myosin heavy chain, clone 203-like protein [Gossypium australe]
MNIEKSNSNTLKVRLGIEITIMAEAVTQVQEVADHLQSLAVQAEILSLKYESESNRGRELPLLLRKVKAFTRHEGSNTRIPTNYDKPVDPVAGLMDRKREKYCDPTYPLRFTLVNVQRPTRYLSTKGTRYHKTSSQHSAPVNYPTDSSSNPEVNLTNPVVLDLDDMAEMDRARVELPK